MTKAVQRNAVLQQETCDGFGLEPTDEGGFTVIVPVLPGCISEGDSKEEVLNNIREAIELYLEPLSA